VKTKIMLGLAALFLAGAGIHFGVYDIDTPDAPNSSGERISQSGENKSLDGLAKPEADEPAHSSNPVLLPDDDEALTLSLDQPQDEHWWQNASIYQLWLGSFYDSDSDGYGDLAGLTQKLDYIEGLGVDAIWLTPFFESPSYHGYDATDYYAIDPRYGTMADFDALVAEANKRGLRIVLDLVLNHVSDLHPWFLKAREGNKTYRDYFVWRKRMPEKAGLPWQDRIEPERVWHGEPGAHYYGLFSYKQPDLNYKNPQVLKEMKAVSRFWLNKGVDGFRLDAVRYLVETEAGAADTPETLAVLRDYVDTVKSINPEALLVGEAYTDTGTVGRYHRAGLDAAFDFEFSHLLEKLFAVSPEGSDGFEVEISQTQKAEFIKRALRQRYSRQLEHETAPHYFLANFLNNHDRDRSTLRLGQSEARAKVMASLFLTFPGTAYLYYGEEIGMSQHRPGRDRYRRALMQWETTDNAGFNQSGKRWLDEARWFEWDADFAPWWADYWQGLEQPERQTVAGQRERADSLLEHYQRLIALRSTDPVLRQPDSLSFYKDTGMAWVVQYRKGQQARWLLLNLDPDNSTRFQLPEALEGYADDLVSNRIDYLEGELRLEPAELRILVLQ